jgi:hypothetical protein
MKLAKEKVDLTWLHQMDYETLLPIWEEGRYRNYGLPKGRVRFPPHLLYGKGQQKYATDLPVVC